MPSLKLLPSSAEFDKRTKQMKGKPYMEQRQWVVDFFRDQIDQNQKEVDKLDELIEEINRRGRKFQIAKQRENWAKCEMIHNEIEKLSKGFTKKYIDSCRQLRRIRRLRRIVEENKSRLGVE